MGKMSQTNSEFILKYEQIYKRDPRSKIFAPLAEAYRKVGQVEEALKIATQGVHYHPEFAGGRVAFAKVLLDLKKPHDALLHLKKAVELSHENVLAYHLLAETYLELRNPKEALKAFKMLLFLNPQDPKAKKAVKKLESLTADEFGEEVFKIEPVNIQRNSNDFLSKQMKQEPLSESASTAVKIKGLERFISLADAFIVRNDLERAESTLRRALEEFGTQPEISNRLTMLSKKQNPAPEPESLTPATPHRSQLVAEHKRALLEFLLQRINAVRFGD